jgi:ubiquinone/menaquinone biosynthesis C-methylase UbiE
MNSINNFKNLEDENFCLKFELDALANLLIRNEAERWVPGFIWPNIVKEHKSRYDLALKFVENKTVLDIACGSGYGAYLLAKEGFAQKVYGCDLAAESVHYGNVRYPHQNVIRTVENAEKFTSDIQFDVVVSFETIEHLSDYKKFLSNIYAVLKPDGYFLVSTPLVNKTRLSCDNPHHKIEWSFNDFRLLIEDSFLIESTYLQSVEMEKKKESSLTRILSKFKQIAFSIEHKRKELNPFPELFIGQYDAEKIFGGYQILICRKRLS